MLTQTRLRELLEYDPETGVFRWRKSSRRGWTGREAGCLKYGKGSGDYVLIRIEGETLRASRLAWLYMTGAWPDQDVDHANLNRSDNRWSNLRLATRSQNMANGSLRSNNTSGYRGVTWDAAHSKWRAQVRLGHRNYYCGLFDTPEAAALARDAKAATLHGAFVRFNTYHLGDLH